MRWHLCGAKDLTGRLPLSLRSTSANGRAPKGLATAVLKGAASGHSCGYTGSTWTGYVHLCSTSRASIDEMCSFKSECFLAPEWKGKRLVERGADLSRTDSQLISQSSTPQKDIERHCRSIPQRGLNMEHTAEHTGVVGTQSLNMSLEIPHRR